MLCAVAALTCRSHCPPQLHTVSPGHRALAGHLPRLLFKAPSARYVAVACTGPLCPPHTSLVWHTRVAPSRTVPPRLGQCLGRLLFRKCCWVHTASSVSSLPETQGQHGPRQVQGKHSLLCPVCVRRQPDSFVQMSHLKKKKLAQQRIILRGPSSCWPHTSSLSKELLLGLEATEREREAA